MQINKFLLFLLIGAYSCIIKAQENVLLGIHTGVNYSSLRFEDNRTSENDSEISYLIGVSAEFYISKKLYLDIELNYERDKVSVYIDEIIINSVSYGGNYRNYDIYEFLSLPIMLKYEIGDKNPFYLKGGPYLGYLLSAKERINKGRLSKDVSVLFTDFDFGLSIGVGKVFNIGTSHTLVLELRNNLGLTNINSDARGTYIKTNSINLIVGFSFVL